MSIYIRTDATFTLPGLPKLQDDPALASDTLFMFDLLDPLSWPSQAAPSSGAKVLNMAKKGNATTEGAIGWDGGFLFQRALDSELMNLPANSKIAAGQSFGFAIWYEPRAVTGDQRGIAGLGKGGAGYANTQYSMSRTTNTLRMHAAGTQILPNPEVALGTVYQLGITAEFEGGAYTLRSWMNGAQLGQASAAAMADPLDRAVALVGGLPGMLPYSDDMVIYRIHGSNLIGRSRAEFIATDYAARAGQFG